MTKVLITEMVETDVENAVHTEWMVTWDAAAEQYSFFNTAAEALAAVRKRDQDRVNAGAKMSITMIEWEPVTEVGRRVVTVLARSK